METEIDESHPPKCLCLWYTAFIGTKEQYICQKEPIRNSNYTVWHSLCWNRPDDEHYITMPEILAGLGNYGITADRKSIYQDLKDLEVLGIEVEGEPDGKGYHYHVVSRPFWNFRN